MSGGVGKGPARTKWGNLQKKRCKNEGCKKRVKSYPKLGICNKCINEENKKIKWKK